MGAILLMIVGWLVITIFWLPFVFMFTWKFLFAMIATWYLWYRFCVNHGHKL